MSRQMTSSAFHKSKTLDNKYMLGDEIGKGAYGRVYKGLDLENGDFVAIKQVSLDNILQEGLSNIMQEIDLLKNLNHKNIVKYLGSLKTKSHLHIILEYVENGSLANIIKPNKFGPFPESLVAVYISQVLEGLVYLHEQGVIHRDIKGANILTTKEGLVKLADFGVATKLNEADVNTHSVVGTPYWMAPEVIEMSGVCAASDIWGVGCTVIELLTCVPPYYDLQPMPALYRIVQDEQPPIPDSVSPSVNDFLRQCFKKDARRRPDAKTLLSHPWIQNSRRALQSSLRHSGTLSCRDIEDDEPGDTETTSGEQRHYVKDSAYEKEGNTGPLPSEASQDPSNNCISGAKFSSERADNAEKDIVSDEALTPAGAHSSKLEIKHDSDSVENITSNLGQRVKLLENDEIGSVKAIERDMTTKKGTSNFSPNSTHQQKATNASAGAGNELNRFSDPPGDATLDDLFHPLEKLENPVAESSTSASSSHADHDSAFPRGGKNDLATKLRAAIAQKQMENESAQTNGGDLYSLMMGVLKEDGLEDKLPAENLVHLQVVEFSKLVSSLRPDEPEDVIISACQKLTTFFQQRPEQKAVFITQHGLLRLMELLEFQQTHIQVICAVLQILNEIIKDNPGFQENACLVGLVPIVMSFAVPDQPWEVRMEAAYFFKQLCQSSSLTLQMFISCRGIPILVGFLMADYAKYREMVHMAIDGMCQVVKLQKSTSRNDFCRIAAKNGILQRLTNTLYSLNEANRLASFAAAGFPADGLVPWPRSQPPDLTCPSFAHPDAPVYGFSPHDPLTVGFANLESSGGSRLMGIPSSVSREQGSDRWGGEPSRAEIEAKQVRGAANVDCRLSTDLTLNQLGNVRPLLSLLDKEPPSRRLSGRLEYVRHITGADRQDSVLPLSHASGDKKSNGLDFLMAEFEEVSGRGRENTKKESMLRSSSKPAKTMLEPEASNGGIVSTGIASNTVSGVLSGSGVLNARPASAASSGFLSHMVSPWNIDVTREYLEKVADLLLEFASADAAVKSFMCGQSLLSRLFQMFNKIEPPILLKLLKCINHLSTDPHCLEHLQRADAIKYLIPNLDLKEGHFVSQIHHEVLSALFNLCKINKRRQEQSAENGIIPHLMNFIMTDSPLKQFALPLLFDMAHASRNSREQLRAHGGLDVYLSLLEDEAWSVTALDSLAVCLAHDSENKKVEQALLRKDAVHKLVKFFECCPDQHFLHILEPFLKIITKSSRINTTLAVNGLTPLLITRLDHQDAIARLNLLKLIKAVYEHHPRPKQLIVENDLPQRLQNLIEERRDGQSFGGQVLVKQMATSLLKALHINTVL